MGEYIRVRLRLGPGLVVSPRCDDLRPNDRKPTTKTAETKPQKKPSILPIIDGYTAKQPSKRRQATDQPTNAKSTVGALMNACELIVSDCMHWRFSISTNTPSAASRRHGVTSKHTITSRRVLRHYRWPSASSGVLPVDVAYVGVRGATYVNVCCGGV